MNITFVTLFEELIKGYFEDSILKRARDKSLFNLNFLNPRDFSTNKHNKVDSTAYSGGAGMLMSPQPLFHALDKLREDDVHIIFATPVAKQFNQKDAVRLSSKKHIVFVSGRYEGIDERVIETYADEVFSIGDYILTGGELPSMVMSDAILRNVDGVLGNSESLEIESFDCELLEAPSFTKPEVYIESSVPKEYLKGNHAKIRELKLSLSKSKTKFFRPKELSRHLSRVKA